MRDCRLCSCDCAGCQDRRHILTTGEDGPVRTIGCWCGAPDVKLGLFTKLAEGDELRRQRDWARDDVAVEIGARDKALAEVDALAARVRDDAKWVAIGKAVSARRSELIKIRFVDGEGSYMDQVECQTLTALMEQAIGPIDEDGARALLAGDGRAAEPETGGS